MSAEHIRASQIDLIDTVLDKGIVIDPWLCVSVAGIDLVSVGARRVVVASSETRLQHAHIAAARQRSRPAPKTLSSS
jgi:hypothetical protein